MAATVGLHWLWTESGLLLLLLAGRTGEHFMKIAKVGWGGCGGVGCSGGRAEFGGTSQGSVALNALDPPPTDDTTPALDGAVQAGNIHNFCHPNSLFTLQEYLVSEPA